MAELCGKIVKTQDGNMPCVRPKNHQHGCNPFSDTCPVCGGYGKGCVNDSLSAINSQEKWND